MNSLTQATQTLDDMDESTRIQFWKETVGDKTRGRCYGVAQLEENIIYEVIYLTHVSITNPNRETDSQAIEAVITEDVVARANARTTDLAKQFEKHN